MTWVQPDEHHHWKEIQRRVVAKTPIFTLSAAKRRDGEAKEGEFVLIEAPEWVTIIPVLEKADGTRDFLMVRQFRHGSGELTVEFPAGAVDPGEDPADAAARELLEETGHRADEFVCIGSINPNPAFMTNHTHTFVALGLQGGAEQSLDLHERVEFAPVPEKEVFEKMGTGEYGNGVMLMALAYYRRWRKNLESGSPGRVL
ncbi:NUDIX hydrolase [Marispirochaeta aestuarii]|uniref:NUDIX hydrolase n=1 Tax=Marispirochaeta aestuarii TaxID=1963862 RepID=UPI0029C7FE54|nr:NUDIX hydrolase [Marispirochaeta aestuarii]